MIEYNKLRSFEAQAQHGTVSAKVLKQIEMLEKELARFEKIDEAVNKRLNTINNLMNELDLLEDLFAEASDSDGA